MQLFLRLTMFRRVLQTSHCGETREQQCQGPVKNPAVLLVDTLMLPHYPRMNTWWYSDKPTDYVIGNPGNPWCVRCNTANHAPSDHLLLCQWYSIIKMFRITISSYSSISSSCNFSSSFMIIHIVVSSSSSPSIPKSVKHIPNKTWSASWSSKLPAIDCHHPCTPSKKIAGP